MPVSWQTLHVVRPSCEAGSGLMPPAAGAVVPPGALVAGALVAAGDAPGALVAGALVGALAGALVAGAPVAAGAGAADPGLWHAAQVASARPA